MITDNVVLIKGASYDKVKKALNNWLNLYSDNLPSDFKFKLYKKDQNEFVIKAGNEIDNNRFHFLVNYLKYPEGIEYQVEVVGYIIGKDHNELQGQRLLIYISDNDTEYDNVFAVNSENKNFKIDFGGKISIVDEKNVYKEPEYFDFHGAEIVKLDRNKVKHQKLKKSTDKIEKNFKLYSLISLGIIILSFVLFYSETEALTKSSFYLGMGLGLWFYMDYPMLQINKYYIYSILISLAFLGYAMFLEDLINIRRIDLGDLGAFYPISVLIVQKPARFIFKAILRREPMIDKPPATFWDGFYMIVLFAGFAILPFIIYDLLK